MHRAKKQLGYDRDACPVEEGQENQKSVKLPVSQVNIAVCVVSLLNPGVFVDTEVVFTVDTRPVGPSSDDELKVTVTTPSGKRIQGVIETDDHLTHRVYYTPTEEGSSSNANASYETLC